MIQTVQNVLEKTSLIVRKLDFIGIYTLTQFPLITFTVNCKQPVLYLRPAGGKCPRAAEQEFLIITKCMSLSNVHFAT